MAEATMLLALALTAAPALAAPTPVERGALVGAISLGAEVAGAAGAGLIGAGLGGISCRDGAFECFGPFIGAGMGVGIGAVVGAPLGAGLAARGYGARPGRTAAFSLGGLGIGVGVSAIGVAAGSGEVAWGGIAAAGVLMPVMAGVGAGTDRETRPWDGPVLSASPLLVPGGGGVRVAVVGF